MRYLAKSSNIAGNIYTVKDRGLVVQVYWLYDCIELLMVTDPSGVQFWCETTNVKIDQNFIALKKKKKKGCD